MTYKAQNESWLGWKRLRLPLEWILLQGRDGFACSWKIPALWERSWTLPQEQSQWEDFWRKKQSGRGMLSGWIGHFSPRSIMKDQWKVINTQRSGDKVDFIHAIPFQRTCWVVCITWREQTDEGGSPKRTSPFLGMGGGVTAVCRS